MDLSPGFGGQFWVGIIYMDPACTLNGEFNIIIFIIIRNLQYSALREVS